jgi:hypothetical protein
MRNMRRNEEEVGVYAHISCRKKAVIDGAGIACISGDDVQAP